MLSLRTDGWKQRPNFPNGSDTVKIQRVQSATLLLDRDFYRNIRQQTVHQLAFLDDTMSRVPDNKKRAALSSTNSLTTSDVRDRGHASELSSTPSTSTRVPTTNNDNADKRSAVENSCATSRSSTERGVCKKTIVIDLDGHDHFAEEEVFRTGTSSNTSISGGSGRPRRKRRFVDSPQDQSLRRKCDTTPVVIIDNDETPTEACENKPSKEDEVEPMVVECPKCKKELQRDDAFIGSDCRHPVCKPCMIKFLTAVVDEKQYPPVCLACSVPYHIHACLALLGDDTEHTVLHGALERLVLERTMFEMLVFCSNVECGTPFDWQPDATAGSDIDDDDATAHGRSNPRIFCPLCSEQTCARCKAPWHNGLTCKQFKGKPA